jgi:hypothetical protein
MTFRKADAGKPRMSLLPPRALMAVGRVLTFGADRYGPDNWRHVDDRRRYVDAAMRHLLAMMAGEENDPDSGENHLAHLVCSALFLLELDEEEKLTTDDAELTHPAPLEPANPAELEATSSGSTVSLPTVEDFALLVAMRKVTPSATPPKSLELSPADPAPVSAGTDFPEKSDGYIPETGSFTEVGRNSTSGTGENIGVLSPSQPVETKAPGVRGAREVLRPPLEDGTKWTCSCCGQPKTSLERYASLEAPYLAVCALCNAKQRARQYAAPPATSVAPPPPPSRHANGASGPVQPAAAG